MANFSRMPADPQDMVFPLSQGDRRRRRRHRCDRFHLVLQVPLQELLQPDSSRPTAARQRHRDCCADSPKHCRQLRWPKALNNRTGLKTGWSGTRPGLAVASRSVFRARAVVPHLPVVGWPCPDRQPWSRLTGKNALALITVIAPLFRLKHYGYQIVMPKISRAKVEKMLAFSLSLALQCNGW